MCDTVPHKIGKDALEPLEPSDGTEGSDMSDTSSDRAGSVSLVVREDMSKLESIFAQQNMRYKLIDRIGEGTFSTVYKAEDLMYETCENNWDNQSTEKPMWSSPQYRQEKRKTATHYVAIKKIYVTSSPMRIFNELEILHKLRGCSSVCPLITAFRYQDQVVAVLPYFSHQDFRTYYRRMTVADMKVYFRSLLEALAAVHKRGIIHRDVKPTNFLWDRDRQRGVLVDFGLAERQGSDASSPCMCQESPAIRREKLLSTRGVLTQEAPKGFPKDDQRPSRRANRAGTRGFRAPEVLLKCTSQGTKIDVWSVGVILLTILAQRFPFFNSTDDVDAMVELATIYGKQRVKQCALLHGAALDCNISTVGERGHSLASIVLWSTSIARDEDADYLDPDIRDATKFLESLMDLDPKRRISASAALNHPFLSEDSYETEPDEMDVLK